MQPPAKVGKVGSKAEKMQVTLHHHHTTCGLPLCISGITHRLALAVPLEIADHDRRRDAMRRQRSQARGRFVGNREMGRMRSLVGIVRDDLKEREVDDLDCSYTSCTAKAA